MTSSRARTTSAITRRALLAGAFGLANAFGAVIQGRLMDRVGQTRVLRPAAAVHLVAVAAHYLLGFDWTVSLLIGAALAPTDPARRGSSV